MLTETSSIKIIFIMGLPGSGKTYVAEHLSAKLSAIHISSDRVRKTLLKQGKYQPTDKQEVYKEMKKLLVESIQEDKPIIIDTTFYLQNLRDEFEDLGKKYSKEIYWILTTANEKTIKERVSKKRADSEADFPIYQLIRDQFEPIKKEYLEIKTDTDSIAKNLDRILKYCNIEKEITIFDQKIVNVIETHISIILLTEGYVYKIKKPVRFSFIDFSSLKNRKYYCEEELRLNKRITENMYLEVVPITEDKHRLFIGKDGGKIVDYAVKMKRIEASKQMHLLLEKNKITKNDIEQIATRLVSFHKDAKIIKRPLNVLELKNNFNDLLSVQQIIKEEFGRDYETIIEKAVHFSDNFISKNAPLFRERIQGGMIRDVHGDLHSGNIFIDKEPIIFDCIEFNSNFREIDILNELAFFCIDLDAFNQQELATFFIEKYLMIFPEVMTQQKDSELFLYYKLYRANIRAKVLTLKSSQLKDLTQKKKVLDEVSIYLNLMNKILSDFSTFATFQ